MKRFLALLFLFAIIIPSAAFAAKARSIASDADSSFHAQHLHFHIGEITCHATGNYIKIRSESNKNKIIGHLEQKDIFELLDVKNGYALIRVANAHKTSPDSQNGMTGWVDSDYIDCTCSFDEYVDRSSSVASNQSSTNLKDFIGTTSVICTGNNLRVRNMPNGAIILGHLEKADEFILLDIQNDWAQITVTKAASTSPDSWAGLSGWVSAEYIIIKPNATIPAISNDEWDGYSSILDYFYQAIIEKWDTQRIVDSGFFEPYYFPDSLNEYGFSLYDLNSDGTNELIVSHKDYLNSQSNTFITAIYTLINNQPIRILESWTRSRNYLCADGSIYNEGSNGAAYSIHYIYDLIGSYLKIREGVLSGDYTENGETKYGWFLVDERADFTYAEHTLISDKKAEERIALYQSTVTHQLNNFTTFAEYGDSLITSTPQPVATATPNPPVSSDTITISGSGTNLYDKAFNLPSGYLRIISKRSVNYNISFPEITLYYLDEDTGKNKSRRISIPEGGTAQIIEGPLNILYYTSEAECDWEIQFSPIRYADTFSGISGSGSYISDFFPTNDKPQVLTLEFTNTVDRYASFNVTWGIIDSNGKVSEHYNTIVNSNHFDNETKNFRKILTPVNSATAYFFSIDCSENTQWKIIPD